MSETTETPMKFYHADNTNRFIVGPGGVKFSFDSYKLFAGTWRGVYRSSDPQEQAALDAMVADAKSAVKEISEQDYLAALKKKHPFAKDFKPLEPVNPQSPPPRVAEAAAKVSASETAAAKEKPSEVEEAKVSETAPVSPRRRRGSAVVAEEKANTETPAAE